MPRIIAFFVSDVFYVKWQYKKVLGRRLDLKNPVSFNEKIQWLKLNWKEEILTICADKYRVRDYVKSRVGDHILTKLYGVYNKVDDIILNDLPESFVMKTNHSTGQYFICKNKNDVDWEHIFKLFRIYMTINHYYWGREFAYKNIVPKIICEEYLEVGGSSPRDYKIYCFNGEPRFVEVHFGRFSDHRNNLYDLEWNLLPVQCTNPQYEGRVDKPGCLDEMWDYATKLAKNMPFVRVDLYNIGQRVYFGEMTFYPTNGVDRFTPDSYDYIFGSYLQLPNSGLL